MPEAQRPLILDFGLHQGEDTEFYLACGADVIAFEANGALVDSNNARFAEEIASGRLRLVAGAIVQPGFDKPEITFYIDEQKSVWGTTSQDWAARNATLGTQRRSVTVRAVDLSAILTAKRDIYYAKVDIEGADHHVLDAFAITGARPEFLSIESDKEELGNVIAEIEFLQELGFTRFAAVQQASIPGTKVTLRNFEGDQFRFRFRDHSSGPFGPFLQQDYKTAGNVIDEYRAIFRRYETFGDRSWLMSHRLSRLPTRAVNKLLVKSLRKPLCGWYDTHAAA
jgi:FkbM family methyltransferase